MPLPRFVELVRVSSAGQAARETPEDQRRALDALRRSRPGVLVERIEQTISGATDAARRPDLQRLQVLAEARAFDEVRVRHLDRLTRHDDPLERAIVLAMVRRAGAVIVDASGSVLDPRTMAGELQWVFATLASADERRKIVERTVAARRRLAAEGKIQGRPPWGRTWDKRTGKWGEDRAALAVYRRIFREVLAGRSLAQVADRLNADEIPTPRGRAWTPAHVSRLVRARSATGVLEGWGQRFRIPAVVDEQTWRAALAALKRNRQERAGPPGHHPALLRRVLRCGACGANMWVQRGGRPGDVRTYYVCSTYRSPATDDCRRWHAVEPVDEKVRAAILENLRQPSRLGPAAARRPAGDPIAEAEGELAAAERALKALGREEERTARLATRGLMTEEVGSTLLGEIALRRNAAEVERAATAGRLEALRQARDRGASSARGLQGRAAALERAGPAAWRTFLREQFPAGYGIDLWPNGRILVRGLWDALRRLAVGMR